MTLPSLTLASCISKVRVHPKITKKPPFGSKKLLNRVLRLLSAIFA
ncbi:hypothetical protein X474_08585 [Dethiosulfatarculus sandiegensis]|uniref:Uncharacterized protein n=1 Tax=Dethiosulfatarculus sandiegensis TaxID=1429043 RepID=A0A0D2J801_9BACT|nr:hypothetical protein X474_08585 [Dethiosulfatarculus sandiegensis]